MSRVTIADVAEYAKVSKSTVSQYLNGRYTYMSENTKTLIKEAIEHLGYTPNIVARSLKQKITTTIGVIVTNILYAYSTQVIRAIEDICHEKGFHTIICNADDDPEKEKNYIEMLQAKQVDGIILFPTGGNVELYQRMYENGFPVVFISRYIQDVPIPSIVLDNEEASRLAVEHFISRGYERIGIITTPIIDNIVPRRERVAGFKKALIDNRIPVDERFVISVEVENMIGSLKQIMEHEHRPQAILASNDTVLMEVLKYCMFNKVSIPHDLAVIGIDDVSFASFYNPPLTTIAQPTFEMGKKAAEILFDRIFRKETTDRHIIRLAPKLVQRSSS